MTRACAAAFTIFLPFASSIEAAEPSLWQRPASDQAATDSFSSYYEWDAFSAVNDPVYLPDVASIGLDGALLTASGSYIVTSSQNLYGLPSLSLSLPGYQQSTNGYTTIFLQAGVVAGSQGVATAFQLNAGGTTYTPQVSAGGGIYFQVPGSYSNISLSFSASADHTSIGTVAVDTIWSLTAPDIGSLSSGGSGLAVVGGGTYSSMGFGYTPPVSAAPNNLGSLVFNGAINSSGTTIQTAALNVAGVIQGNRVVRTDAAGNSSELGNLGTTSAGFATMFAGDINEAGTAVGQVDKVVDGVSKGTRAVVWDAETGAVTELPTLGISTTGTSTSLARDINGSGAIAGRSLYFNEAGVQQSNNAVRWEAGSHTPTNLGVGDAYAINDAGTVVGISGSGSSARPARWDAGSSTPVILATTSGVPMAINEEGVITGNTGPNNNTVAVRWDAGSTTPTTLAKPASFNGGTGRNSGLAVDDSGNIVGYGTRYSTGGANLGDGAVLWKAGEVTGIALDSIGTDANGNVGQSFALDINNNGYIVGSLLAYDEAGTSLGFRAVVWDLNGDVLDLNTLIDPNSGWTLLQAQHITDNGWISGVGKYSSTDGIYERSFSIHASQFAAVPEPGTIALLSLAAGVGVLVRFRRK